MQEVIKWDGFTFLYMPVWSLEELEACRIAMYPEMQVTDIHSRFDHWGGIPRFVLEKLDDANQRLLVQAIASATLQLITDSVGQTFAHSGVSNQSLHLHVDADFVTTTVRWASIWVAEEVAIRLHQHETNQLKTFLSAAEVSKDLGGIRGILWEGYCHRVLAGGGDFKSCYLGTAANPVDVNAQAATLQASSSSYIVGPWPDVRDLPHNVYSRPRIKNLPAFDSVMQPNKLYQITVSSSHLVNCKGLLGALSGMQDDEHHVSLYFVVPTDIFQNFTAQNITQGDGVVALRAHVQQFVLEVSLTK